MKPNNSSYDMLQYNQAFYEFKNRLLSLYDEREAVAITHEILQHVTGLDKTQRLLQKETLFTAAQQQQYDLALRAMAVGVPLQYVTGAAWFMGKEYRVNSDVLIPRPETEELVQWVIDDCKGSVGKTPIIDIGTGSGCIAISLKLAIPDAEVTAMDMSNAALSVAKKNAERLHARIAFLQSDFLDAAQYNKFHKYDVIVSNPPYIPISEKGNIHTNVKDHEPHMALFVPDKGALLFYKALALFGKEHLNQNGYIYCELNSDHALACKALFEEAGYPTAEIRQDMNGNRRMLKAGLG